MAADRRIGSVGDGRMVLVQLRIQRIAHAVQALELEAVATTGQFEKGCDGERIVGGELRKDPWPQFQQPARAIDEVQVGHFLVAVLRPRSAAHRRAHKRAVRTTFRNRARVLHVQIFIFQRLDDLDVPSPYMLLAPPVQPDRAASIAAVVHVDGTARVQTVHQTASPRLAAFLGEFERITSVPAVSAIALPYRDSLSPKCSTYHGVSYAE